MDGGAAIRAFPFHGHAFAHGWAISYCINEYHESYNALIYLLQCAAPPQCLWLIPYTTLIWCVDMGFWEQRFQTETCTLYISVHLAHALIQHIHESGQIIATSHDLTPIGGLVREFPLYQGNLGW